MQGSRVALLPSLWYNINIEDEGDELDMDRRRKDMNRREAERAKRIYDFLAGRGFGNLERIAKGSRGYKDLGDPQKVKSIRTLKSSIRHYMNPNVPVREDGSDTHIGRLVNKYNLKLPHDMEMMKLTRREKRERFKNRNTKVERPENVSAEDELQERVLSRKKDDVFNWDDRVTPSSGGRTYTIGEMKETLLAAHERAFESNGFPRGDRFRTEFLQLGREISNMTPEQIMFLFAEYSRDDFYEYISIYGSRGDGINTNGIFMIKQSISKAMSV